MGERIQHGAAPTGPEPSRNPSVQAVGNRMGSPFYLHAVQHEIFDAFAKVAENEPIKVIAGSLAMSSERWAELRSRLSAVLEHRVSIAIDAVIERERAWPASYQETFNAIASAVTHHGDDRIGISVKAFYRELSYPNSPAPAPCDEPAKREDATAAEGQSPAGAVDEASSEVEAPASQDLKALQAENDRLTTALAESERKRVEAVQALRPFACFAQDIAEKHPGWDHDWFEIVPHGNAVPHLILQPFRAARALLSALLAREEAEHGR